MNFTALDLNLLRVFDAMARELSTVRAGERIGLSQPAVSSALGRLRHFTGDELFVREGNRMIATPRALEMAGPVRDALEGIENSLSALSSFDPASARQTFMLVGSDYFSTLLMPPLAARITPEAPGVVLQMIDHISEDLFATLANGKADLAVDRALETPEWIHSTSLYRSWLVCLARRGHPLLAARGIHPGDAIPPDVFCAMPQVMRSADGGRSGTIDPALARLGLSRNVTMTVPHFHAVALTIASGDLLGSIPVHFARIVADRFGLDIYNPPFESPAMDVRLYWHRRMERDAANAWLRAHVIRVADHDPDR